MKLYQILSIILLLRVSNFMNENIDLTILL